MPTVYVTASKEDEEELTVFEAPDYIADQIYGMEPGQITSISGLAGDHVWEDFTFSERQALDRFVEALTEFIESTRSARIKVSRKRILRPS